jgi:hypothetical protein
VGTGRWRRPPLNEESEASGLVAEAPPHCTQEVAVVGWRAVLPALPERQVDVQDRGAAHLQLQVVPGRPSAVSGVNANRVGVALMVGSVGAAARQVDPADERDAAPGVSGEVDDQELLVVAAEPAYPLVGD